MKKTLVLIGALILTIFVNIPVSLAITEPDDHMSIAMRAAVCGDIEAGRAAINRYNEYLNSIGSEETRLDFDRIFLLSKLIYYVAGEERLGDEWRMCTGEVVLNRVASPEFPDSMEEVIYQPGQYDGVDSDYFAYVLTPTESCVEAAIRLLRGERLMEPQVVFQASTPQGGGLYRSFYDHDLGNAFFCVSPNSHLYPSA